MGTPNAPVPVAADEVKAPADSAAFVERSGAVAQVLTYHRRPMRALTGLRFFAASYVILYHTRLAQGLLKGGHNLAANFVDNGFLAVTLFFMLSGLILAYNYRGQIESRNQTFRFWEARFARIWPAYVFSLLCSSIPISNVPIFPKALATLCMVQAWDPLHPANAGLWNFVCWTLSVEAFFYVVFPFLQKLLERLTVRRLAWFGAAIVLAGILCNTPGHNFTDRYEGLFFYLPPPITHLPEFITGIVLGNLLLTWKRPVASRKQDRCDFVRSQLPDRYGGNARSGFAVVTWTAIGFAFLVLVTHANEVRGLAIPAFALLLYGLATDSSMVGNLLSSRAIYLGGEISYSMYLLRNPLLHWIYLLHLPSSHLLELLYIPFGLIPLSLLSFYLVEVPTRRMLRRLFARAQSRLA